MGVAVKNLYALEVFAKDRLAKLRGAGRAPEGVRTATPASRPRQLALGQALVPMGYRLRGGQVAFFGDNRS